MYTSSELALLRAVNPSAVVPGIDTPTGNELQTGSLIPVTSLTTNPTAPLFYIPSENEVVVKQDSAVLNGFDFGGTSLVVEANNVAVKNSTFMGTTGYYGIQIANPYSGTVISNNTFNMPSPSPLSDWIVADGNITITNNSFLNTPGDGIFIQAGVVSGNYFGGVGITTAGQHPDAVWVPNSTGLVRITNNFIDASGPSNSAIRITTEFGNTSNVTVSGNYLIGGTYTLSAGAPSPFNVGIYSNISITNNYIGFGTNGSIYPGPYQGTTFSGNVVFDYTNPTYSNQAWSAYLAAGIPTANLVISDPLVNSGNVFGSSSVATTLYGNGENQIVMFGSSAETNFVGGFGRQSMYAGTGKNIFTYLSPANSTWFSYDDISWFDSAKDVIDLSHIDADPATAGQQNFTFIGTAAFSGSGKEVRYWQDPANNVTYVEADLAGGSTPDDLYIQIDGLQTLTAANFALTAAQSSADLGGAGSSDPSVAPTIAGTVSGQSTASEAAVNPFAKVTIADSNANATDTLTITLGGAGGVLSGTGLSGGTGGVYTLSGTAPSELDALSFTPKAGAPGSSSTTTFTLSDLSSAYATPAVDSANLVVSTGGNIFGSPSGSTTLYGNDEDRIAMFGAATETNFVGGFGTQYMFGGAGVNIFTELAISNSTFGKPDEISSFDPAKDVIDLSRIDADPATPGVQNFTFIGTAAFSGTGAQVRYQQDPVNNVTYVEAKLAGDTSEDLHIQIDGLQTLSTVNFALTAAQSSADMSAGAALKVSLANAASGPGSEYSYTNVQGRSYSSFESFYTNNPFDADLGDELNLSSTADRLNLYSGVFSHKVTVTRGSGGETLQSGTSTFSLVYHSTETIQANAFGSETFVFGSNFGNEAITGLRFSGASADTIQLSKSSFSYLTPTMTQALDLAAVLAHATSGPSGTTISDSYGDTLALTGLTASTITANASHFSFA